MSALMSGVNKNTQVKNNHEKYDVKLGIHKWKCYPEYKDSGVKWIGEIPKEWEEKRLKHNSYIKGRIGWQNLRSDEFTDEGPYLITGMHFSNGSVDWDSCYHITKERYEIAPEIQVKEQDVLITKDGSIGKMAYIDYLPGKASLNSHLLVIRPLRMSYHPRFLYYFLGSNIFEIYIYKNQTGTTFFGITQESIANFSMIVPSLSEQQTIVSFLDHETSKIDALIEKKQLFIELLEEKRATLISHAVTKGLDPNTKMKDSGVEWIGEIPESWDIKPFRRICSVNQGLQIAQSERFYEPIDTRLEYITIKSIHNKNAAREYIENPPKSVVCHQNDILLARTGATGEVITNQEGVFHNNFFLIKYNSKKVYRDFLVYYLKNKLIKSFILLLAGTTTIPDLNHGDFLSVPFISPSFKEQQSITNFLDRETEKIDTLINKISIQIEKLKEYRTALISAAVTGKVDVREEVA